MSRNRSSSWTEERIQLLKTLWHEGLSCAQIAARIGGVSRNAVIGKRLRLGLPDRRDRTSMRDRTRPFKTSANTTITPTYQDTYRIGSIHRHNQQVSAFVEPVTDTDIAPDDRRQIADMEPHHCRWPIGDPRSAEFGFCNRDAVAGLPYCQSHAQRAFRTVSVDEAEKQVERELEDA